MAIAQVSALLLPFAKVRLQRRADARVQERPEFFAERALVERHGLLEAPRHQQTNSPTVQVEEKGVVADQELADYQGGSGGLYEQSLHEVWSVMYSLQDGS